VFVWLDGNVIPEEQAVIKINSPAFRYGEGFFTTIRIESNVPLWLEEHVERLKNFENILSFPSFSEKEVIEAARLIPFVTGISEGILRIVVFEEEKKARVYINAEKFVFQEMEPVRVSLASFRRHSTQPLLKVKSLNYLENVMAYKEALKRGFCEGLFLNEKGEVCETTRFNIFWVTGQEVYTPAIDCGVLPGITRRKLIELCRQEGIEIKVGRFTLPDLKRAQEVFLTNSLRGIVSVKQIEEAEYTVKGSAISLLKDKLCSLIQKSVSTKIKDIRGGQ